MLSTIHQEADGFWDWQHVVARDWEAMKDLQLVHCRDLVMETLTSELVNQEVEVMEDEKSGVKN